jgi:cysteine synthase A
MVSNGILTRIGNTPLIELSRFVPASSARIAVKPEYLNPSGSIKDRIALRMIEEAERQGRLRPGMNIIEASTGNTATALAFVGAAKGYKVTLHVPKNATSEERIRMCRAYGAEVVEVDIQDGDFLKASGVHGALAEFIPRKICYEKEQKDPENIWWARQFSSEYNVAAHQDTTAREILEQTSGKIDAFVAAIGTGGTLVGVAKALHDVDPSVRIVAVEPKESRTMKNGRLTVPVIEGYSGGILLQVTELADEVIAVEERDAVDMCHRLAEEEGLFCGVSSGANVLAALQVAQGLGPDKQVVTILPDSRDRYVFVERFTT